MERTGLKSMRMTVVGFGPNAYEVYFLSFGKSLVGFIPELAVCHAGWNEPEVLLGLREELVKRKVIGQEYAVNQPKGEIDEQQSNRHSPARAGRKSDQRDLF